MTHKYNLTEWTKVEKEQDKIVSEIEAIIKKKQKVITVLSATGTGKSVMIKKLISRNLANYYFVIRTLSKCGLEKQLKENLSSVDSKNYYIYGDAQLGRKNNKITFDDIKKVWKKDAGKRPLIYIKDECHIEDNAADNHGYDDFLCKIDFSATPENEPDVIGSFEHTPMLKKLVEYNCQIDSAEEDAIKQIGKTVVEAIDKLLDLRKIYKPYKINPALIIKTSGFFHIDELQLEPVFKKNNIKYIYIDQNTAWDELNDLRKDDSEYSIVITKEKIKEGFDMPRAAVCVWTYSNARYSVATYTQLVGRCRRNAIFLQDNCDIHTVPESLQTSYIFKTHILTKDDELAKPSDFEYGEEINILELKKSSKSGEILVSDKGDRFKYYKKLELLAAKDYSTKENVPPPPEIKKIRINNWVKSSKIPNYNYFEFYDENDKLIDLYSKEALEYYYYKSHWKINSVTFDRFDEIFKKVLNLPIKKRIVCWYQDSFLLLKSAEYPMRKIKFNTEEEFLANFDIPSQKDQKMISEFFYVNKWGYDPTFLGWDKTVNSVPDKERVENLNNIINVSVEKQAELCKEMIAEQDQKKRVELLNKINVLAQSINDTNKQLNSLYAVRKQYVHLEGVCSLLFFGDEIVPEYHRSKETYLSHLAEYASCQELKQQYDHLSSFIPPLLFKMIYWQTAFLGIGTTRTSTPVKQYLLDTYVVKNESEILAAKIVNEFNFFERDIESASLTEEVCKEYIYSNFTKKLTHAYLDKLIGLISAVRKKDKLYVISRSKHKEEIFDSIINAVYTIVKLLETKIPKREMQMTTFEHLLGSAGFTIGHTSINVKFKKVLTKDDIYQQLLNNKLFGIKEMYLVCPLQNKIFKLDYEEVKSEQKKLTD